MESIRTVNSLGEWQKLRFFQSGEWERVHDAVDKPTTLPRRDQWYRALELQPSQVKCVILGQDPYPTAGHAMGLAFSVPCHVSPLPRSLANLFREYQDDLGYPAPKFGDLSPWVKEGVLLLNTVLTVREGEALSHAGLGWERLTHEILSDLGNRRRVVFCLLGKKAQEYKATARYCPVVSMAHPSPLSASKGFFGSKPFSKINQCLTAMGASPINWKLT